MAKKKAKAKKKVAKKKVAKKKVAKKPAKKKAAAKKKPAKKKVAAKKAPAKKAAVVVREAKPLSKVASAAKKARTKTEIMGILAETSGLTKKEVAGVFDSLAGLINLDLGKKGPGVFSLPGLMKIVRVKKPAVKARKGVNPFTGEEMMFKAKPARNIVKVRALKGLKEMV